MLTVWKFDRLSHSLKNLLLILDKVGKAGAGLLAMSSAGQSAADVARLFRVHRATISRVASGAKAMNAA